MSDIVEPAFLETKTFDLNGCRLTSLGVAHTASTLEVYGSEIQAALASADVVITEYLPFDPQWEGSEINPFFLGVISILEKKNGGTNIICADPLSPQSITYESIVTLGLITGPLVYLSVKTAAINLNSKSGKMVGFPKISRRNALRLIGTFTAGCYLNYTDFVSTLASAITGDQDFEYGLNDQLVMDFENFRNIVVGDFLGKLTQELGKKGGSNIALVYGNTHIDPIIHYAQNPDSLEVNIKAIPSALYGLMGNTDIRHYSYDPSKKLWLRRT